MNKKFKKPLKVILIMLGIVLVILLLLKFVFHLNFLSIVEQLPSGEYNANYDCSFMTNSRYTTAFNDYNLGDENGWIAVDTNQDGILEPYWYDSYINEIAYRSEDGIDCNPLRKLGKTPDGLNVVPISTITKITNVGLLKDRFYGIAICSDDSFATSGRNSDLIYYRPYNGVSPYTEFGKESFYNNIEGVTAIVSSSNFIKLSFDRDTSDVILTCDNYCVENPEKCIPELIGEIERLEFSIEETSARIAELGLTLESKIEIINGLTFSIAEKAQLIDELTNSIEEQAQIIVGLRLSSQQQVIIIEELATNIDKQAQIISEMKLTSSQQVDLIKRLTVNIEEQAEMINQLTDNLQEKANLVKQLQVTNQDQAELIAAMELSFSDQAGIITSLNKKISDDVIIISNLDLNIKEQGNLINELELTNQEMVILVQDLRLTTDEQVEIIDRLDLNLQEKEELVKQFRLTIDEQDEIIEKLEKSSLMKRNLYLLIIGLLSLAVIVLFTFVISKKNRKK